MIRDIALPMKSSSQHLDAEGDSNVQVHDEPAFALAQISPDSAEMRCFGTAGDPAVPLEGSYVAFSQSCPAFAEIQVAPCLVAFPAMSVDSVQTAQPWGHEIPSLDSASGFSAELPCFALPQSNPAEVLQQEQSVVTVDSTQPEMQAMVSHQELQHSLGHCRPCAWFWREQGCHNGDACGYCHLCPQGELKSRKKNKIAAMRMGALIPVGESSQSRAAWGLKLDTLIHDNP